MVNFLVAFCRKSNSHLVIRKIIFDLSIPPASCSISLPTLFRALETFTLNDPIPNPNNSPRNNISPQFPNPNTCPQS